MEAEKPYLVLTTNIKLIFFKEMVFIGSVLTVFCAILFWRSGRVNLDVLRAFLFSFSVVVSLRILDLSTDFNRIILLGDVLTFSRPLKLFERSKQFKLNELTKIIAIWQSGKGGNIKRLEVKLMNGKTKRINHSFSREELTPLFHQIASDNLEIRIRDLSEFLQNYNRKQ